MERKNYNVLNFGAVGDGKTLTTSAIQKAIDTANKEGGGIVTVPEGKYLIGSIYVKSNVELVISEGAEIIGILDENKYPTIWTRVAGIEMNWPSALINVLDQKNVKISGKGLINGQGAFWWNKYWGPDRKGGMRNDYDARGLRWVVDYDCTRPRLILVWQSSEVEISGLSLIHSPFWNVHICYSNNVRVDGLTISQNDNGPSTDGIDIDSSKDILVENCDIDCNDDNICIKAGRDADGLRVNRPTENIIIRNCITRKGHGMVTLGSETSGGMKNILVYGIKAMGTNNGIRFKSATVRGGVMENIKFNDIEMHGVKYPIAFNLNWNPSYSYAEALKDLEFPDHWKALAAPIVPPERGIPVFKDIDITNVTAVDSVDGLVVDGLEQQSVLKVKLENVHVEAENTGHIKNATDWIMKDVVIKSNKGEAIETENCVNVELPAVMTK